MAGFNSPPNGQGQSESATSSPYSNRITYLFPRLNRPPPASHSSPTTERPPNDTAAPRDTRVIKSESKTHQKTPTTPPPPPKPLTPPPSAIATTTLKLAQISASPGEFWLVDRDGCDPWPAIICDERIVAQFFKKRWRSRVSSRRSDGTWGKKFREHGELVGKRTFPALLLAVNKCVWVPCHCLLPLDLQMAAGKCRILGEGKLSEAYRLAAEEKPLRIWEDVLIVHRRREGGGAAALRSVEGGTSGREHPPGTGGGSVSGSGKGSEVAFRFPPGFVEGDEETEGSKVQPLATPPPSSKRPKSVKWKFEDGMQRGGEGEATFRFPPGFVEGDKNTEKSEALSLPTPPPSGRKSVKREFDDGRGREEVRALYEGSDADEEGKRQRRRAKRVRQDSAPARGLPGRQGTEVLGEIEVVEID